MPKTLLEETCPSQTPRHAEGDVWLEYTGSEGTLATRASVVVAPDRVTIAIVNLVGETEGLIKIEKTRVLLEQTGKRPRSWKGSFEGIPISMLVALFQDSVPCPDPAARRHARLSVEDDELVIRVGAAQSPLEAYRYQFRMTDGRRVPDRVVWQSPLSPGVEVKFFAGGWRAESESRSLKIEWRRQSVDTAR